MDYIIVGLSLISLIFYLAILFLLFEIKIRLEGNPAKTFIYMIIAIIILIALRIMDLLSKSGIFVVPYLHESLVVLFALFFLLGVITFYKSVCEITDRNIKSSVSKKSQEKKLKTLKKETFPKKNLTGFRKKRVDSGGYLDLRSRN